MNQESKKRTRRAIQPLPAPLSAESLRGFMASPPFHRWLSLVAVYAHRRSTKDMTWKCSTCGETHEDQFDSCWKCGIEREGNAAIQDFKIQESQSFTEEPKLPCSTTPEVPGRKVNSSRGIVCGEAIMGANFFRDIAAGITNMVGGRSGAYETTLREGRETALKEMMDEARAIGGNAVIGVDIDYETVGANMLMVTASGTAVVLEPLEVEQVVDANLPSAPQTPGNTTH